MFLVHGAYRAVPTLLVPDHLCLSAEPAPREPGTQTYTVAHRLTSFRQIRFMAADVRNSAADDAAAPRHALYASFDAYCASALLLVTQ